MTINALSKNVRNEIKHTRRKRLMKLSAFGEYGELTVIFSSLLTIGGSFAKNLNLLAQKEKNNI